MSSGAQLINQWVKGKSSSNPNIVQGLESIKSIKNGETIGLVFYNSLGWPKDEWVSVPCNTIKLSVTDLKGNSVPIQISLARGGNITSKYIMHLPVLGVPSLGYKTLFVTATSNVVHFVEEEPVETGQDVVLQNQFIKVTVSGTTGRISQISNLAEGISALIDQNLFAYTSQSSGAYVFGPEGPASPITTSPPKSTIINGQYVQLLTQVFQTNGGSWAQQTIKLYSGLGKQSLESFVEIMFTIGVLPGGTEVVSRFTTNIRSESVLFTDDNGYEHLPRVFDFSHSIGESYFPMIYSSYIQDTESLFAVYSERTHGVSSLTPGQIEVMLHRNPNMGDGAGPSLTDTTVVYPSLRLGFSSPATASLQLHNQPLQFNFPLTSFSARNAPLDNWKSFQLSAQFVNDILPVSVHLLSIYTTEFDPTLRSLCNSCVIVRFTHLFLPHEDRVLPAPVDLNLSQLFLRPIVAMSETTLTANTLIRTMPSYDITISSKEIRTFVLKF